MSKNNKQKEKVWFDDITHLFNQNYITNIIPFNHLEKNQNINAIVRLSLLISVICIIVFKKIEYIFIVIGVMIVTYIYYNTYVKEHFPDIRNIYKPSFSKPYNPLSNKLLGELNDIYDKTYLVSSDTDIKKNILYKYNKIRQKLPNTNISEDLLNTKEALLGFYPLPDKTGIPDFSEFAKNVYGTTVEDRSDLIKRGFISKADINRQNSLSNINDVNYDPLNINKTGLN